MSASRLAAPDRLARLLAVIPWVAAQNGARLDDISARFDYPRAQLLADLQDVVFFVGVHPFTPDTLIDVDISDDQVRINYADWFAKPLRLTVEERARLLTAGRSMLAMGTVAGDDDPDAAGALLRALTKLRLAGGDPAEGGHADDILDIRMGDAPEDTLDTLRTALHERRRLRLEYYSYGRDELGERDVDPQRLFSDQGNWYLAAFCHRADGDRVFRVDRIRRATVLDTPTEHGGTPDPGDRAFSPGDDDPRVELVLTPAQRWVVEQYPTERVDERDDGTLVVTMAVTAQPWIERLLLQLGPTVEIRRVDDPLDPQLRAAAADRVLRRYR